MFAAPEPGLTPRVFSVRSRYRVFEAKWNPVRVKKTRQIKKLEPFTISVNW
jgi:hypothetical protein